MNGVYQKCASSQRTKKIRELSIWSDIEVNYGGILKMTDLTRAEVFSQCN